MAEIQINKVEDILQLKDIQSMMKLFKQWGIKAPKTANKDIFVSELVKFYKENGAVAPKDRKTGGTVLQEALQYHRGNREKLMKLYDKVVNFYRELPVNFQQDLNSIFPDIEKNAHSKRSELSSPECNILVAGEATSGKSSLINLLLEADILPTSGIKCTQTVCEIRKSKDGRKKAICFGANGGQRSEIDLSTKEGQERLRREIVYEDDYGDNPYEKIEIYWPTDVIEEGLVIIDTPGFGDNQMHKSLKKYLSKSCGFIYVVNTANAGGVQRGRLKDFLRNIVNSSEEDFSPSSTLFICNKWDVVPPKDREEIKRGIVYRLEQIFQGLRQDQIFYFSTTEAKRAIEFGTINSGHEDLISNGLQRLFPASLRQQLNSHYRWLSQILKRANYSLKVSKTLDAVDKEEMTKKMDGIKRNMDALEAKSRQTIDDLRKGLQYEITDLHKTTADVLRSRNMLSTLTDWNQVECPPPDDSKKLAKEAAERIASKVAAELNRWEKEQRIIHSLKEKMIKKFKRDCELLEDQIITIEGTLVGEQDKKIINDLHKSMKKQAPVKALWRKAKRDGADDDVRGLGGAVGAVGSVIASNKKFREIFKGYKKDNNTKKMAEATVMFIESLFQGNELMDKISNYLGKLVKGVDEIAKKIPEFLKADSQLLEKITHSVRDTDDKMRKMYPQLISSGHTIQGELDLFYVYYIMDMDYRLSDVEWDRDDLLGSGSFADVFKGQLKLPNQNENVALKYCKDPLSEKVISDILLEDRTLRELQHPNIIQYYGCTLQQSGKTRRMVHWIMIMEYCDDTLKSKFISPDYENPGKVEIYSVQIEQMEELARYAVQICGGLEFLHKKKMVHRDMKLENILTVKKDGQDIVKLTDVGLTKREDHIGGSILGSPVYMAPEVLVPKGIYDRRADIYALGIMLWEMWYGIDAADHIQQQLYTSLEKAVVDEGLRPSLSLKYKPDENWQNLIKACWAKDQNQRPEATDIKIFFEKFLRH
ncbi:tyrosine-protein kinase Fer-like [Mytilus edulis]|uniref:tyrosine-protein kinase Fer-like n=1 Tax=Mytilus edulis TaxID=6550 RepID=UPI0039EEC195